MTVLLEKLCEKTWRKIDGKPWTEIIRDEWKKSPLFFLIVFSGAGIVGGE